MVGLHPLPTPYNYNRIFTRFPQQALGNFHHCRSTRCTFAPLSSPSHASSLGLPSLHSTPSKKVTTHAQNPGESKRSPQKKRKKKQKTPKGGQQQPKFIPQWVGRLAHLTSDKCNSSLSLHYQPRWSIHSSSLSHSNFFFLTPRRSNHTTTTAVVVVAVFLLRINY